MTKRILIVVISFLAITVYAHRFTPTTPENKFRHFKTSRIDVAYLPNTFVAQNVTTFGKTIGEKSE